MKFIPLVPLRKGKVAIVDDADFEAVSAFKWHADKKGSTYYAARNIIRINGKRGVQYMHQFLMPGVAQIDHRFGDGLDNQRENIRPATNRQNQQGLRRKTGTSSKFRGVTWHKLQNKWLAQITVNGKHVNLGVFTDEIEAARAYDAAARKYFGEFASPNFDIGQITIT